MCFVSIFRDLIQFTGGSFSVSSSGRAANIGIGLAWTIADETIKTKNKNAPTRRVKAFRNIDLSVELRIIY